MNPGLLLAFLLFHAAGADPAPVSAWKTVRVGDSVTFPVSVPKGVSASSIFLRASSRGVGVAVWLSNKELTVFSVSYSGRVTFLENEPAFRIANLSLDDGGTYEVSMASKSSEMALGSFTVAVINITKEVVRLDNSSCTIDLFCEAGMGPRSAVTYFWKDQNTGTTLVQAMRLRQTVHDNSNRAFTCTAQTATLQSAMNIDLKQPCFRSSASSGGSVLGLALLLARGLLGAAVTAAPLLLL